MFQSLRNSWQLFGDTLHVLSHDKELIVFPILSGVAAIVVIGGFAAGMWGLGWFDSGMLEQLDNREQSIFSEQNLPALAALFIYYFVNYFIITYFNAALVGAACIRLQGGDPTLSDGFAAANRCLPSICGYATIAATVGMILRLIESRSNTVGRMVTGVLGLAWSLVTYLIVPVLVIERVGPAKAIGRSASLFRETWGEQIIANIGFGLIGFLLTLLGLVPLGVGIAMTITIESAWPVVLGGAIALVYWLVIGLVISAMKGIYTAALYSYATHKPLHGFSRELVAGAFSPRH